MRFLLIGDIHKSQHLQKITEIQDQFDAVLINGDFLSIQHPNETESDDHDFQLILDQFEIPVFYVPGNHDPKSRFNSNDESNIHQRWVEFNGVCIGGLGGAVGGIYKHNGEEKFEGFPYNQGSMASDFNELISTAPESFILLTHCGPSNTPTTDENFLLDDTERVDMGADCLYQFHLKRNGCMVHVHGHSHHCFGMTRIGHDLIVNPGALEDGRYGVLELTDKLDAKLKLNIQSPKDLPLPLVDTIWAYVGADVSLNHFVKMSDNRYAISLNNITGIISIILTVTSYIMLLRSAYIVILNSQKQIYFKYLLILLILNFIEFTLYFYYTFNQIDRIFYFGSFFCSLMTLGMILLNIELLKIFACLNTKITEKRIKIFRLVFALLNFILSFGNYIKPFLNEINEIYFNVKLTNQAQ
ncbi:hypothetical protein HDV06_001004 [Boothiomyces sp. JEL0866]|nr:hypothetical protein HDV06_001004 [Boothiomyces sp. JEL0866]